MAANYKATLKAMTLSQLKKHQKEYPEDTNITDAINEKHSEINAKHSERISGKVKDAGPKFFNLFPGMFNSTQEENSSPLMKEFEFLKREKGMSEGEARHYLENKRSEDPKAFEEEFNIGSYRDLSSAFDHGWDSAKVLDTSGILRTTNASMFPSWEDIKTAGGKALTGLESLFFSPLNAAENKDSFTLPEKKPNILAGSVLNKDLESFDRQFPDTVYEDIGQYANRKIPGLEVDHRQNYDKATYLGNPYLNIDEVDYDGLNNFDPYLNIDTLHWDETDRQNAIHHNALNVMKQGYEEPSWLERHNTAQREYNRVAPGANVTSWGEGHGNPSAAVQGRRNEAWMNSLIGNYTMGIGGTQDVKQNLINKYGTVQQQQNFADAIARKAHNPYANYDYFEGQGVDKADITADVTGMYTDDPSGLGGIFARGGLAQRAPRGSYLNGGLASLWPR